MLKDQFKTRLEIAKNKILKKNKDSKQSSSSNIGVAFKLSAEMVAAVVVGTIMVNINIFFCRSSRWNSECD